MSGRFWSAWAGARSDRRGEHEKRNEEQILNWKKERVAGAKKKSAPGEAYPRLHRRKRTEVSDRIVAVPGHPADRPPILQYNFSWKTLSVAAGLTLWNFYFRIYEGAIKKAQVVDFLKALVRHLGQPLLIVWDRLPGHRSRLVQEYIAGLQGWISTAYLPPYAPELNPVEYIWGYWKQHELPNVCPKGLLATERSSTTNAPSHAPPVRD